MKRAGGGFLETEEEEEEQEEEEEEEKEEEEKEEKEKEKENLSHVSISILISDFYKARTRNGLIRIEGRRGSAGGKGKEGQRRRERK